MAVGGKFGKCIVIASDLNVSSHGPDSWARLIPSGGLLLAEASSKYVQQEDKDTWNLSQNFLPDFC